MKKCIHCGRSFRANPRVKNHNYCNDKACQRARRALWQREKMAKDIDCRDNQRQYEKEWQARHPGYYRNYRAKHSQYVKRNRLQQVRRDARRRSNNPDLLAKMDSLVVNLVPINRLELYGQVPGCLQKRT